MGEKELPKVEPEVPVREQPEEHPCPRPEPELPPREEPKPAEPD